MVAWDGVQALEGERGGRWSGARPRYRVVVLAAASGGVPVVVRLVRELPRDFAVPVVIVQQRAPKMARLLAELLRAETAVPVQEVTTFGQPLVPGTVHVAPADRHLHLGPDAHFEIFDGIHRGLRASADPLLESAADSFPGEVVAVVLSGEGDDGVEGVKAVARSGGVVLVQAPETASAPAMPAAALAAAPARIVSPDALASVLAALARELATEDVLA